MAKTVAEKAQYSFVRGLITEQSPVSPIEGSAIDMENFEIETTGALRRRRAINLEHGGVPVELDVPGSDAVFTKYMWRNAGGDPDRTVLVTQIGVTLYFWEESETLSTESPFTSLDLTSLAVADTDTADLKATPLSFADGRSHLFFSNRYIAPVYISLLDDSVTVTPIPLRIRDFVGIDDGVEHTTQPETLTETHKYNLLNRGWTTTEYTDYFSDKAVYPSKAMIPYLGYVRNVDPAIQDGYGIKEWNSNKMEAEVFGDAPAPQGRFYLDPFDTTVSYGNPDPGGGSGDATYSITEWTIPSFSGTSRTVTMTTSAAHGLSTGSYVTIQNNQFTYRRFGFGATVITGSLDGTYQVTVVDTDTFTFVWTYTFATTLTTHEWVNQYASYGQVVVLDGAPIVSDPTLSTLGGYITAERPRAVAYWAGRVWYAGIAHDRVADTLFFSQITEGSANYGRCHQLNDPTSEILNAVLSTDGGTIKVPGLHGVLAMQPLGSSLLVISTAGIWEIRGGQSGFTALDYLVRKVTDAEVVSARGVCRTDSAVVVATKRGLYAVGGDPNSGLLGAQNVTEARVNTYWLNIPATYLPYVQLEYDDARHRVYTILPKVTTHTTDLAHVPAANEYTEALVLDTRMPDGGAFYKISLPLQVTGSQAGYTAGIIALASADGASQRRKIKFPYINAETGVVKMCDMDHEHSYSDVSGLEHVPWFRAAAEVITDPQDNHRRKRVVHWCYMFMKRTEIGYEPTLGEPMNASSLFLQARWDFSDNGVSGKWSSPQQVYRHKREYIPSDPEEAFQNGYPVVFTRNKLRGTGQGLSIYVYGEAGKDAHLFGWAIQYGVA